MGTDRENGSLYTKIVGKTAFLEFGHPAGNSFVAELLDRLTAEFERLSENEAINVIVLRSEGDRAFCGGASFDELLAIENFDQGKLFFNGFANVINAMRNCNKVIVGRVQGKTVGGGVGLAAACDYVFASVDAAIRLSELTIGIAPLVIAPAVERKMGKAALSELSLSPTAWKNAYWAQERGLFSKVYDTMADLDKDLEFYVAELAAYHPMALRAWRKVLWEGTEHWGQLLTERAAITGQLALSEFTKKALRGFKK
ncbi:MAG: enoyl-CoA hydratase/isomerase family protein [Flavobacteriaceae bacterium]